MKLDILQEFGDDKIDILTGRLSKIEEIRKKEKIALERKLKDTLEYISKLEEIIESIFGKPLNKTRIRRYTLDDVDVENDYKPDEVPVEVLDDENQILDFERVAKKFKRETETKFKERRNPFGYYSSDREDRDLNNTLKSIFGWK